MENNRRKFCESPKGKVEQWIDNVHRFNEFQTNNRARVPNTPQSKPPEGNKTPKNLTVLYRATPKLGRMWSSNSNLLSLLTLSTESSYMEPTSSQPFTQKPEENSQGLAALHELYLKFITETVPKILKAVFSDSLEHGSNQIQDRLQTLTPELKAEFDLHERQIFFNCKNALNKKLNDVQVDFEKKNSNMRKNHQMIEDNLVKEIQELTDTVTAYETRISAQRSQDVTKEKIKRYQEQVKLLQQKNREIKTEYFRLLKQIKLRENALKINESLKVVEAELKRLPIENSKVTRTLDKLLNGTQSGDEKYTETTE